MQGRGRWFGSEWDPLLIVNRCPDHREVVGLEDAREAQWHSPKGEQTGLWLSSGSGVLTGVGFEASGSRALVEHKSPVGGWCTLGLRWVAGGKEGGWLEQGRTWIRAPRRLTYLGKGRIFLCDLLPGSSNTLQSPVPIAYRG